MNKAEKLAADLRTVAAEAENISKWIELAKGLAEGINYQSIYISQSGVLVRQQPRNEECVDITEAVIEAITKRNQERLNEATSILACHIKESEEEE